MRSRQADPRVEFAVGTSRKVSFFVVISCLWCLRATHLEISFFTYLFLFHRRTFKAGSEPATQLCVSPNGSHLLSASMSIRLWDVASESLVKKFSGHERSVSCLAFSSDKRFILSGAMDRFVCLWSTGLLDASTSSSATKERTGTLPAHFF